MFVVGRNFSGRGANSTPAKCTTASTPETAGGIVRGSAEIGLNGADARGSGDIRSQRGRCVIHRAERMPAGR